MDGAVVHGTETRDGLADGTVARDLAIAAGTLMALLEVDFTQRPRFMAVRSVAADSAAAPSMEEADFMAAASTADIGKRAYSV
jgi:hypothetical protein